MPPRTTTTAPASPDPRKNQGRPAPQSGPPKGKGVLSQHYGASPQIAAEIAADVSLPQVGFQDPPPGIKHGIAQLDEVGFAVFKSGTNEGKPYFYAVGVIQEPTVFTYEPTSQGKPTGEPARTVKTAGMTTRIQEPIFDTSPQSGKNMGQITTMAQHAKVAAAYMRMLGIDTSQVRTLGDLEGLAEALTSAARDPKSPIYFYFETSSRKSQKVGEEDGAWQNWRTCEGLENYSPPDAALSVEDTTAAAEAQMAQGVGNIHQDNPDNILGNDTSAADAPDIDALLAAAQNNDADAQTELNRLASEASGRTVEDIEANTASWEEVADIARGEAPPPEEAQEQGWQKGEHCMYRPLVPGPKGKGMVPGKKALECEITHVNEDKRTAMLKSTVDGKTVYKDIPWDDLTAPS